MTISPTPTATIRREVGVTLRLGGFATEARLITFHGLVDGREHLAIGLGERHRLIDALAAHHRRLPAGP